MAPIWDEDKRRANFEKHGVDFTRVDAFEWDTARVITDERRFYGEPRFIAIGVIRGRLHVLVFTRRGNEIRVISLRKANRREVQKYAEGR
jgi:uncharacterized DUF497 family protein